MANFDRPLELSDRQRAALAELSSFPLMEALIGRRSRRFPVGGEIPDGPLASGSRHAHVPLTELETLLILSGMGGTTGWHNGITRHEPYALHPANYNGAAAGRTIPSAAGFHTSELFYTDDPGLYFLPTRDAGPLVDPAQEKITPELMVARHRDRVVRLADTRLYLPRSKPYLEGHNTRIANEPGSLLVIPIADIAQHHIAQHHIAQHHIAQHHIAQHHIAQHHIANLCFFAQHHIANLCFFAQNGYGVYDDINQRSVPGLDEFSDLVDMGAAIPLSFVEQYSLTEATAELVTSSYNGALMLQAMGRRGWSLDGIEHMTLLGASGEDEVPASAFVTTSIRAGGRPTPLAAATEPFTRSVRLTSPRWPTPSRRSSSASSVPGGPYHPDTPGAWNESSAIRCLGRVSR